MKSFKNILSEVAQPKGKEEKAFKDQHVVDVIDHPAAEKSQFTGEIEGKKKKKNLADYDAGQDVAAYDKAYAVKDKPFKMPRNESVVEQEEVEQVDEKIDLVKAKMGDVIKDFQASDAPQFAGKSKEERQKMAIAAKLSAERAAKKEAADKFVSDDGVSHVPHPVEPEGHKSKKKLSFKEMIDKISAPAEEIQEDAWEEIPMMQSQLNYIIYAAQEIMEFLDSEDDPEEWYQNKLSGVFYEMQSLHAYVEGQKRMYSMSPEDDDEEDDDMEDSYYGEETETTEEEEVEQVDEGKGYSPGWMLRHPHGAALSAELKARRERERARRKAYGNPSAGVSAKKEEVEMIDEAVKAGTMKLKNGDMVKVSDKDAKVLNQMLGELNDKNRKQMEKIMMTDKNGFEEILGFAKEAL